MNLPGRKARLVLGGLLLVFGCCLWAAVHFSIAVSLLPLAALFSLLAGGGLLAFGMIAPQPPTAPVRSRAESPRLEGALDVGKAKRILIIEGPGQPALSEITDLLRNAGYECRQLNSSLRVLEVLQIFQPHLLITEMLLPGMDGLGLIQLVRHEGKGKPPIIVVSSCRGKFYINQAFELGIEDYIFKPYENDDLLSRIKWVLDKADAPR
jgi:CheY-like chemotaxis protein